jgi:hypothetical protein
MRKRPSFGAYATPAGVWYALLVVHIRVLDLSQLGLSLAP